MHGLAHGEIRIKAGDMALFQSVDGGDEIYPDGPSVDLAVIFESDDPRTLHLSWPWAFEAPLTLGGPC